MRNVVRILAVLLVLLAAQCLTVSAQSQRRILLEEFSTAPCGFCPDGDVIARQLIKDHPSVIWVTHHAGFGTDSMTAPGSNTIANAFVNFAPSGVIDRVLYPKHVAPYANLGTIRSKWDSLVVAHLGDEQYAQVNITSTYRAATAQLECAVSVVFSSVPAAGDMRIHLFVVEDSISGLGTGYDQHNYYNTTQGHPCYGAGDPIVGYTHHRVVSAIPTGAWGVAGIIPSTPETNKTYTWTWTGDMNTIWDKCNTGRYDVISLVAFVSYYTSDPLNRPVIHAGEARITNVILGTDEAPAAAGALTVAAHPNPASNLVTITAALARNERGTLVVTDAIGREIANVQLTTENPHHALATAALPAGLYFTRLVTAARSTAGKFIVLH